MVSASIPLSTAFTATKTAAGAPPRPSASSVRFRVSASYATAERMTSTSHNATASSLYEVLGIPKDADCREIKSAYRRLARLLHPDVVASDGQKGASTYDFIRIHAAYATLSDPQKRADYDRTAFRRRIPVSSPFAVSPTASNSGYRGRRWETDQCW